MSTSKRATLSRIFLFAAAILTASFFFRETIPPATIMPSAQPRTAVHLVLSSGLGSIDSLAGAPVLAEHPLTPVDPVVVSHGLRTEKLVALTFDACSTHMPSHYDSTITKILIDSMTPATIFLGGKWMTDEPGQTRHLASIPFFELANHTFYHPHLTTLPDDRVREEISSTQKVMFTLTGRRATLFRAPYGEYDDRVVKIAASLGLTTIQYDLASGDPDPNIPKDRLVAYVSTMAKNGSIIVMHINQRGWHTADALPEIITRLRKRGFTFVTVSQLIERSPSSLHGEE